MKPSDWRTVLYAVPKRSLDPGVSTAFEFVIEGRALLNEIFFSEDCVYQLGVAKIRVGNEDLVVDGPIPAQVFLPFETVDENGEPTTEPSLLRSPIMPPGGRIVLELVNVSDGAVTAMVGVKCLEDISTRPDGSVFRPIEIVEEGVSARPSEEGY